MQQPTLKEQAALLKALATVMLAHGIDENTALKGDYDSQLTDLIAAEGVDRKVVEKLLECDAEISLVFPNWVE